MKKLPVESKNQRIDDEGFMIIDEESDDFCYICGTDDNLE